MSHAPDKVRRTEESKVSWVRCRILAQSALCSWLCPWSPSFPGPCGCVSQSPAAMPYKRYVEIGRVAMINYGDEYGQLVAISDVIDQNRVRMQQ